MPFLVDSVVDGAGPRAARRPPGHPPAVRRGPRRDRRAGQDRLPRQRVGAEPTRGRRARVVDARRDRPDRPRRGRRRDRPGRCSGCCATSASRSRTGTGCTPAGRRDRRGAASRPAAARSPPRSSSGASRFLEWLSADHFTFLGYREYHLEQRRRRRATCAAVPGTGFGILRTDPDMSPRPASCRARSPSRAREKHPAGAGQGQLPLDRAPPGVPRLRRREDVRRGRRGRRRAPLPRAVLQRRLHRVRLARSRCCARRPKDVLAAGRPRPPQPRRQGADRHPRDLPARRAVPHAGRRARHRWPRG